MSIYRITTNGVEFRIERRRLTMFRKREVWKPLVIEVGFCTLISTYPTYEKAEARLQEIMQVEQENAVRHDWVPA